MEGNIQGYDQDEGTEFLDPRIKEELERLNTTSAEINRLEKELDDARQLFRQTLSDSSSQLNEKARQNKRSIRKAIAYHEANALANKTHKQAQEAAHKYHRAVDLFNAAKETIACAEEASAGNESKREFDTALQELLNYATMKLNNAEVEKKRNQAEHDRTSQIYMEAKQRVEFLAKKFKRSIAKSREYYETKEHFHSKLEQIKTEVETLQKSLTESKKKYREALRNLEEISEGIHQKRKLELILETSHRGTGVGADSTSDEEVEELQVKFDIDEASLSDAGSVETTIGGRDSPDLYQGSLENLQNINILRRNTSGCSQPDNTLSQGHRENSSALNKEEQFGRERGDGISPVALMSSEQPFREDQTIENKVQLHGNKMISRNSSRGELEISEESGFADGGQNSDNSGSDIDIDELLEESDTEGDIETPKKPLRKIFPDMNKDGEVWL